MSEIDFVIFEFQARVNGYLADVRRTTDLVDRNIGRQELRIKSLEREMARSSGAISGHLRGLAGTLAGYFTGRELVGLLDSFTRLQNNLRVAGLEGDALKAVQDRLFASAQNYGTSLEGLSSLYSGLSQISKDLGASQQDVIMLTDATSQALKITGVSAEQAGGALLGLKQVLGSARIGTDDFNQIVEGGLLPLAQAAAASEKFGGSVNRLKTYIKDTGMSGQEFFRLIQAGSADLEGKAAKATLTLSAGFTTLTNALTVYFGEADKANGVSAALGETMGLLAANLDTLIPALAVIGAAIGGRMVASLVAMTGAATAGSAAIFALQARMVGAATTMEALAFAGRGLAGVLGGPVGIAVTALTLGLGYAIVKSNSASQAMDGQGRSASIAAKFNKELADILARDPSDQTAGKVRNLAAAHREAAKAAYEHAAAEIAAQKAQGERALRLAREGKQEVTSSRYEQVGTSRARRKVDYTEVVPITERPDKRYRGGKTRQQQAEAAALAQIGQADSDLSSLKTAFDTAMVTAPKSPGGGVTTTPKRTGGSKSGGETDRKAQTAARVQDEIDRLNADVLRSVAELTNSSEDRALASLAALNADRKSFDRQITLDGSLSDAQRKDLTAARDAADAQTKRAIEVDRLAGLAREQYERESAANQLEQEVTQARGRVDDRTAREKRMTELRLIDLNFSQREADAQREYDAAAKHGDQLAKDIALSKLARVQELKQLAQQEAALQNQSPLEKLRDELSQTSAQVGDSLEQTAADGLGALNDGIVEAIMGTKSLGDVFKNVANQIIADLVRIAIQQAIIKPLVGALFGGATGGLGGLFGGIGKILGFANGTNSAPGGISLVGERGPELVNLPRGAQVIPNHLLGAVAAGGRSVNQSITIKVDAQGALLASQVQTMVSQGVQLATAMGSQAGAAQGEARVMSRGRRRIPG